MDIKYIRENYRLETLSKEHDLSNFKCASDDLNDFRQCKIFCGIKQDSYNILPT